MTSQKPYLFRAIYEWLIDNDLTPYLLADTAIDGIQVPPEYVTNNTIVLNIAPNAVNNFHADNEWISFSARFAGNATELFIPMPAVQAIYGKENNEGIFFSDETDPPPPDKQPAPTKKPPALKVVK